MHHYNATKIPLLGQLLGNDFLVKCELVCCDPFEAATNLGRVQAPKRIIIEL